MEKTLKVLAIKNGTVIDHIPAGVGLKIIKLLKLEKYDDTITTGTNLQSKKQGRKDIIKIENMELSKDQVNQVALAAPSASINIIKNYQVVKKFEVEVPEEMINIVKCPNPKCITNNEETKTKFYTVENGKKFKLKCAYCERVFNQEDVYEYLAT